MFAYLVLVIALVMAVAACGSADDEDEADDTTTTTQDTATDTTTTDTTTDTTTATDTSADDEEMAEEEMAEEVMEEEDAAEEEMAEEVMEEEDMDEGEEMAAVVSAFPPGASSLVEGMPVCEGTAAAIPGGTLRSFGHDPGGFDAQGGDWWAASLLQVFTHLRLTQWNFCDSSENSDYTVYPYLAESWEISDDGLQYTFHIREGVKWQNTPPVNGREVTADDVVFSYRRYLEPEAANRSVLGPVESVEELDKHTVRFTLAEPSAVFLTATAFSGFPIYAPEVLDEFGGFDTMESSIGIGAGPWRLAEYEPGIIIVLERNPDFFRGPNGITGENLPYIDRVEFLMVAEAAAGLAMYKAGDVDHGFGLCACFGYWTGDPETIKNLRETAPDLAQNVRSFPTNPFAIWYVRPKVDRPPFDNQKLRQAVSMVIARDCQAWCRDRGIEDENRELSSTHAWFVPWEELGEGKKYYPRDAAGNPIRDVEGARALANEARAEMGLVPDEIIHTTITTGDWGVPDVELIQVWLAEIGIEADIVAVPYNEFLATFNSHPFEWEGIAYWTRGPAPWDVDARLSPDYLPDGSFNNMGVDDPELTDLILAQRSEQDPEVREQIVRDIQKYLAVKQYEWIIPNYLSQNVYAPWVKNVGPQKSSTAMGGSFSQAWLAADAPGRQ
jgi:ABC-type transport system substrate-binding protein